MADLTITITNYLTLLGGDLTSNWGVLVWGVDQWGSSQQVVEDVGKLISNDLTSNSAISQKDADKLVSNNLAIDTDIVSEYLTNGIWYTVFPGNVTNANSQINTRYASGGAGTGTYSMVTSPTTVWS